MPASIAWRGSKACSTTSSRRSRSRSSARCGFAASTRAISTRPVARRRHKNRARTFPTQAQSIQTLRKGEVMDKSSVESELVDLERKYWTAIMEKDAVVALQLSHDHCVVTGTQGASHIDALSSFRDVMHVTP